MSKLWYKQPANEWKHGLPIGNGKLAAMIFGGIEVERVALNHEWLWRGENRDRTTEPKSHFLQKVRELLLAGRYAEGTKLANDIFGGPGGISGKQNRVNSYQPAGDFRFLLNRGPVNDYTRELDLTEAVTRVKYMTEQGLVIREYFAHSAEDLLVIRISAYDSKVDGRFWLDRKDDPDCDINYSIIEGRIRLFGRFKEGVEFCIDATFIINEGWITVVNSSTIDIRDSKEILCFLRIGTSNSGNNPLEEIESIPIPEQSWNDILDLHIKEYRRFYNRVILNIDGIIKDEPTDERLQMLKNGIEDIGLPALLFDYGRYLFISSSLRAELPLNLQGKWNEELNPPWECDYHLDINLEMAYWPAEPLGLYELTIPLFDFIRRLVPSAQKAAKDLYACGGVLFPIQTDIWSRATPESYGYDIWIGAAAWLSQHLWWRYEYGRDIDFLSNSVYPFLREVALFYESYVIFDQHGRAQIVPSQSPENRFKEGGDMPVSLCVSSAMDIELAREALTHAIQAAKILNIDKEKCKNWQNIVGRLPVLKIGSEGQLLEWGKEFEEIEPGHRHISHLYGLFPGDIISPEDTQELFDATLISLKKRLAAGGGHTGWSRAWTACCFARAGREKDAWDSLNILLKEYTTDSLLDLHPPGIFQIDGNIGAVTAIIEMLFQSHNNILHFLPALPSKWPNGSLSGICGRGGYTVSFTWAHSRLRKAEIFSKEEKTCIVKGMGQPCTIMDESKNIIPHSLQGDLIEFHISGGSKIIIQVLP